MTTIVGGICPRCGQVHDLFLAVNGYIACRNADGSAERIRQLEAERDAARAERLEALQKVAALDDQLAAARAEVAALRADDGAVALAAAEEIIRARREVLADLRAKVRMIPAHAVRPEHEWRNSEGWVPSTKVIDTVPLSKVLSLIEEAGRG